MSPHPFHLLPSRSYHKPWRQVLRGGFDQHTLQIQIFKQYLPWGLKCTYIYLYIYILYYIICTYIYIFMYLFVYRSISPTSGYLDPQRYRPTTHKTNPRSPAPNSVRPNEEIQSFTLLRLKREAHIHRRPKILTRCPLPLPYQFEGG